MIQTPLDPASRVDCGAKPAVVTATPNPGKHFKHVLMIVLENQDYETIMGPADGGSATTDSYLQQLAERGVLFRQFKGLFHNSYPNYLAMIGGRPFPVSQSNSDAQIDIKGERTIGDELTWKNYAEGKAMIWPLDEFVPGCYVRKHVPFASFTHLQASPNLVRIPSDSAAQGHVFFDDADHPERFPQYAFYSPDTRNDGHSGCDKVGNASAWLKKFLTRFAHTEVFKDTLIVVTFDESGSRGLSNHIYTVFLGPKVKEGFRNDQSLNHYNVLRTIEDNFGVEPLADGDCGARIIDGIWKDSAATAGR